MARLRGLVNITIFILGIVALARWHFDLLLWAMIVLYEVRFVFDQRIARANA